MRVRDPMPLRDVIEREDTDGVLMSLVGVGVVLLAITLAAASLYALMSVSVALRTREIGIRIAIGASARGVMPCASIRRRLCGTLAERAGGSASGSISARHLA